VKRLRVYLLTTSAAKAAHLGLLFQLGEVQLSRWSGFRGYPELQVEKARSSLRLGAEYIRARFTRPFIIEDTEVRIEAYSRGTDISYPGFDMKRWWSVTSFAEIDAKCRQVGTRAASQTSNICLCVPGLDPLFFRATLRGEIATERHEGRPRPEAPWLNPTEFGSVFVPQGSPAPFAALSLEESLRFDFRKRAVDQVLSKINELNTVLNLEPSCYWLDDEDIENRHQLTLFAAADEEASTDAEEE